MVTDREWTMDGAPAKPGFAAHLIGSACRGPRFHHPIFEKIRRLFRPGEVAVYTEETPRDLIPGLYCALQGDAWRQSLLGSERTVFNGCLGDMVLGPIVGIYMPATRASSNRLRRCWPAVRRTDVRPIRLAYEEWHPLLARRLTIIGSTRARFRVAVTWYRLRWRCCHGSPDESPRAFGIVRSRRLWARPLICPSGPPLPSSCRAPPPGRSR